MKTQVMIVSILLAASVACGQETLLELSWRELQEKGQLTSGSVEPADRDGMAEQLTVENTQASRAQFTFLTIDTPPITLDQFAILGEVSYEEVEGEGYLEMLVHFQEGAYFSRTVERGGPMQSLTGSSTWRSFRLPFFMGQASGRRPSKLELSVVLPGRGTVHLSPLRLVQFDVPAELLSKTGQWWSGPQAGLIGGIGGGALGCVGALIGTLCWLGRARRLVMGLLVGMIVVGVLSLAAGVVALIQSQPYAVYYPCLLVGGRCTVLAPVQFRNVARRYEEIELRKMQAMDAS